MCLKSCHINEQYRYLDSEHVYAHRIISVYLWRYALLGHVRAARHATKSSDFVAQLCCSTKLPGQLSIFHRQIIAKQTSDTDDDIIINSALLIASTLSHRNKNQQLTRKQTIDQSQLGDRARNRRRIETVILSSNLVARLDKSWATRYVRQATLLSNKVARQSCSTLLRVWHGPKRTRIMGLRRQWKYSCEMYSTMPPKCDRQTDRRIERRTDGQTSTVHLVTAVFAMHSTALYKQRNAINNNGLDAM